MIYWTDFHQIFHHMVDTRRIWPYLSDSLRDIAMATHLHSSPWLSKKKWNISITIPISQVNFRWSGYIM